MRGCLGHGNNERNAKIEIMCLGSSAELGFEVMGSNPHSFQLFFNRRLQKNTPRHPQSV